MNRGSEHQNAKTRGNEHSAKKRRWKRYVKPIPVVFSQLFIHRDFRYAKPTEVRKNTIATAASPYVYQTIRQWGRETEGENSESPEGTSGDFPAPTAKSRVTLNLAENGDRQPLDHVRHIPNGISAHGPRMGQVPE